MTEINERYFKAAMKDAGYSLRQLSKKMGKDHSGVSLMFRGRREMRMSEAAELARLLNLPLTDVLKNAGMPLTGENSVPVIGYVDGEGEVHMLDGDDRYNIPLPEGSPPSSAVVCRTAMSPLELMDGWTIFIEEPKAATQEHLNRLCVVKVKNGTTLLRTVRRGYKPGTFNLLTDHGTTVADAQLEWAAGVHLIRP